MPDGELIRVGYVLVIYVRSLFPPLCIHKKWNPPHAQYELPHISVVFAMKIYKIVVPFGCPYLSTCKSCLGVN